MLLDRHVEALIVVANWLFVDIHLLADFSKRNIPAATIGWELPGDTVSSVMVDNEAGGRLALEHLHKLGHRKNRVYPGPENVDRFGSTLERRAKVRAFRGIGN